MKSIRINLCLLLLYAVGSSFLVAQKNVLSSGEDVSGSTGSISYSVGQVDYVFQEAVSGSSSQGVQQAWEVSVVTELDLNSNPIQCQVYPNPVSERLVLELDAWDLGQYSYQLLAYNGTVLLDGVVDNIKTIILVTDLASGIYFLKVSNGQSPIKTFKITHHL